MQIKTTSIFLLSLFLFIVGHLSAKVVHLDLQSKTVYQNGKKFGKIGTYEELKGKVYFEIDPMAAINQRVVDLRLAKRLTNGVVAFSSDITLLIPTDRSKINGSLIYEFNNRGGMLLPYVDAETNALFSRGFVFVSTGWIGELLPNPNKLRLYAPIAYENQQAITSKIRTEIIGQKGKKRLSVNGNGHGAYEPTGKGYKTATLTRRMRVADPREVIDSDKFYLESSWADYSCERDGLPKVDLIMEDSFAANYIYELIYEAKNPIVQGLGFVGIRDIISFLRYEKTEQNPLLDYNNQLFINRTISFGISQSGRALRMFLYEGFNEDELGRQVFDGAMPMVAGAGMGFFNHRFASPTRFSTQRESHLFPADYFPFTYGASTDIFTGKSDGILNQAIAKKVVPKVMHLQSSAEYWHRCAALMHLDLAKEKDAVIPANVRIYSIVGQHGAGNGIPKDKKAGTLAVNHTNYAPFVRSLMVALDDWIKADKMPPPSVYPTIKNGTLTSWKDAAPNWQKIKNISYPKVIQQAYTADFGLDFSTTKHITQHPPIIKETYPIYVAKVDADNNEMDMLKVPAVSVPTGTYTGWNLRTESMGAAGDLLRLTGGYIPFAKTKKERIANQDSRLSIEEKYGDFSTYYQLYKTATTKLVQEGYLLEEEVRGILELAEKNRSLIEYGKNKR